ncbi:stress responsive A/B barrel domain protein [Xylogone sp. PMI_703]|nr:stress responsive A/B barrel domain protein [Xylogone sp. PMI_703]
MPLRRIVLFRLTKDATEEQLNAFINGSKAVAPKVPGVISLEIGPPLNDARAKGYNMGLILTLESPAILKDWLSNSDHLKLHDLREAISEDSLAFDIEF